MPIVTPAKRRRQFPWRGDIGVAVQNVTDLVRVFLTHTLQRQLCETFGNMSIKSFPGRIRLWAFLRSSVFSRNAEQWRCRKRANKLLQKGRTKFEKHSGQKEA